MAAIDLYTRYAAFSRDFGGWDVVLALFAPTSEERGAYVAILAAIHNAVQGAPAPSMETN